MAQETIEAADSLNTGRGKINSMITEIYAGIASSWAAWTPTFTGFSTAPTVALARYMTIGKLCRAYLTISAVGVSNASTCTVTLPVNASTAQLFIIQIMNNGAFAVGILITRAGSNIADVYANIGAGSFNASGTNKSLSFHIGYEIP